MISEIAKLQLLVEDAELQRSVDGELRSRSPSYKNIRGELLEIWGSANSPNKRVAGYAKYYVSAAFKEAPINHCLFWLGQADEQLVELIWTQVDARIAEGSPPQKMAFSATVFKAWEAKDLTDKNRRDCLTLLGRLKHRPSAKPLVDLLLTMPRPLLPAAGQALKAITGQNYGPNAGDGIAEVTVAAKRWREWIKRNGL